MNETARPGDPPDVGALEVGVLLDQPTGAVDDWLTDARAFDAAGADALWVDLGPDLELDMSALAAALAAVTHRARLVVIAPEPEAAGLAGALDTIRRLSRDRLAVASGAEGFDPGVPAHSVDLFRPVPDEPGSFERPEPTDRPERWASVPAPQGREDWQHARATAAERGATGVIVPAGPRLLDLLRNPERQPDRRDLHLSQG